MKFRNIFVLAGLILSSVFLLAVLWEFMLKGLVDDIFAMAGDEWTARQKWENAAEATIFSGLALIVPVVLFLRNTSERRKSEEALLVSEKRFRDFAGAASDWFWEMDSDLRLSFISDRAFEVMKNGPEDSIGKTRDELAGEDTVKNDREKWRSHLADLEERRPFRGFDYALTGKEGETRHLLTSGVPVFDERGNFSGYRGTGTDITAIKLAEAALRESEVRARRAEEKLSDAIENVSEGFVLFDADDRLVLCNSKFKELYQYTDRDLTPGVRFEYLIRLDMDRGIVVDNAEGVNDYYQLRLDFHRRRPRESFDIQLMDGRWLSIRESRTTAGGSVGIHTDITSLKRTGEDMRLSEEKHRSFAADAAHELRTPLAVLRLHLDNLADAEAAEALHQDVEVMSRMVEQLLAATRLDSLAIGASDEADLRQVCATVAARLAPIAVKEGRSIEVVGTEEPVNVWGNADALEQAVCNLVENAIKYSARGTTVTIEVGEDATVSVIDRGRGILPEIRNDIFKRFQRSDRRTGGSGLGLSIVQRAVEAHGGTVEVGDAPGGGAVFTIRLPPPNL